MLAQSCRVGAAAALRLSVKCWCLAALLVGLAHLRLQVPAALTLQTCLPAQTAAAGLVASPSFASSSLGLRASFPLVRRTSTSTSTSSFLICLPAYASISLHPLPPAFFLLAKTNEVSINTEQHRQHVNLTAPIHPFRLPQATLLICS